MVERDTLKKKKKKIMQYNKRGCKGGFTQGVLVLVRIRLRCHVHSNLLILVFIFYLLYL